MEALKRVSPCNKLCGKQNFELLIKRAPWVGGITIYMHPIFTDNFIWNDAHQISRRQFPYNHSILLADKLNTNKDKWKN